MRGKSTSEKMAIHSVCCSEAEEDVSSGDRRQRCR